MSSQTGFATVQGKPEHREPSPFWQPISRFGSAVAACFQIALLAWFNAFPQWIGVVKSFDEPRQFLPLAGLGFFEALPWINASLGLGLALSLAHLALGHWTPSTRWADVGVSAFGCYVLRLLATTDRLLAPGVDAAVGWLGLQIGTYVLESVSGVLPAVLWVLFWLTLVGLVIKVVRLIAVTVREVGE